MSKSTAGPWYATKSGSHQGLIISGTTGENVAVSYDEDDASLIAAAPELLESLRTLTDWMLEHTGPSDGALDMLCEAMAVIRKADGVDL